MDELPPDWIDRYRNRDDEVWELLFRLYYQRLTQWIQRAARLSYGDAEEIASRGIARAFATAPAFRRPYRIWAHFCSLSTFEFLGWLREYRKYKTDEIEAPDDSEGEQKERAELIELVRRAMEPMKRTHRIAIRLRINHSCKSAARRMGVSAPTFRGLHRRALKQFYRNLLDADMDPGELG